MKRLQIALSLLCLGLVGVLWTPNARADAFNDETIETFNVPLAIPGRVLPPGKYVFKLLDANDGDRNIVQITNPAQTHVYATLLTVEDDRAKPTGKPVIQLEERSMKSPEAIKAWFYPGRVVGEEFVYPKS